MTKLEYVRPAELRAEIGVCQGSVPRALAGRGPVHIQPSPAVGFANRSFGTDFIQQFCVHSLFWTISLIRQTLWVTTCAINENANLLFNNYINRNDA